MTPWSVMLRATLVLTLLLASAPASAQVDEARATTLREEARNALGEGRFEEAFGFFHVAAEHTNDPAVWLELGEAADRLRLDAIALQAYRTFLERLPETANRAHVEGRIRILEHHASGGSFAVAEDGHSVNTFVDWNGQPRLATRPAQNVLVDWQGNPQQNAPPAALLSLAEWDGSMRERNTDSGSRLPTSIGNQGPGMGRALATP